MEIDFIKLNIQLNMKELPSLGVVLEEEEKGERGEKQKQWVELREC